MSLFSPGLAAKQLQPEERLVVGGSKSSSLCCPLDQSMSRLHFLIEYSKECPSIRDLESANGTFVNRDAIREALLPNEDRFMAGTTVFIVRL